jgi:hypothetical protein
MRNKDRGSTVRRQTIRTILIGLPFVAVSSNAFALNVREAQQKYWFSTSTGTVGATLFGNFNLENNALLLDDAFKAERDKAFILKAAQDKGPLSWSGFYAGLNAGGVWADARREHVYSVFDIGARLLR